MIVSRDSSPYTENSSPPSFLTKPSPRDFWSGRDSAMSHTRFDSENSPERSPSPSPNRRSSIEKLKQASRVRNSNIFALETKDAYDPNSLPIVERPSANRPLSEQFVTNSFTRMDSIRKENNPFRSPEKSNHKRTESQTTLPFLSPTKAAAGVPLPASPWKQSSPSPTKSSLARTSQFGLPNAFDPENGAGSDDERAPTPRALHRHAKSVTFHEEPPIINEYEQQTPEPSVSVASDREGSWDSDDFYDEDISFDRGSSAEPARDDSFDADLENADKTPVVLPEDWSRMSPDEARTDLVNDEDDVFNGDELTQRAVLSDRVVSDASDTRPLPPLPGFMARERRDSNGLSEAAERAAHAPRSLPSPPKRASCSKEDILNMTAKSTLTMQDRLALMSNTSEERPTSKSSQHTVESHHEELTITNLDTGERLEMQVTTTEVDQDSMLDDIAPPRISRESILRKVRGGKYDYSDEDDDAVEESEYQLDNDGRPSIAELALMDPDQAVPSRENSRETSDLYDLRVAAEYVEQHDETQVKPEPTEDDNMIDMNSIPAAVMEPDTALRSPSRAEDYDRQSSVLHHNVPRDDSEEGDDDTASRYSSAEPDAESTMLHTQREPFETRNDGKETLDEAMELLTVKDYSEPSKQQQQQPQATQGGFLGLPTYSGTDDDYDFGMKEWITPSPPADNVSKEVEMKSAFDVTANMPVLQPSAEFYTPLEAPPTERDVSPPGTPDSVIHIQDAERDISPLGELTDFPDEEGKRESDPGVPERVASIKTGGKLKTRKSASRADMETMAEQRRIVSGEMYNNPVPSIPAQFQSNADVDVNGSATDVRPTSSASGSSALEKSAEVEERERQKQRQRRKSRKSGGRMDLDLGLDTSTFSLHGEEGGHDGLGLEKEFERVIEGSKVGEPYGYYRAGTNGSVRLQKGYLMRQNTKLVVATNRNFSGESDDTVKGAAAGNELPMSPSADAGTFERPTSAKGSKSPRKPSAEQFMKTEPWNGKTRRKSLRNASALKDAPFTREAAAPPMPGYESAALGVVDEDYAAGSANLDDDVGEGVERGRLFVKVVGVKDLDLPMPRNDRVDFQLTLDNGLHCVTTTSLELGKSAPIGQEFELVVLDDLEFQLTLTTQLPAPPAKQSPSSIAPSSPTKSVKSKSSSGAFSRFLSSPKKRAEKERLEREAAQAEERRAQEEAARRRIVRTPTTWDMLHSLVDASSGSFARAYVNLKSHEQLCFGRPLTVDIPCYNEWALEEDPQVVNSVRSKRGTNTGPVRRPPYVVGLLELQLLYVPKPRGAGDEDMPKSMSSAIREMSKAREVKEVVFEGFLSQQGGDCQVCSLPTSSSQRSR